jgi:uncharacterized RDD family membrane protein YckC
MGVSDVQREPAATSEAPPGHAPAVPEPEQRASSGPSGPRAGFWRRFAAAFLDGVLLGIVNAIIGRILKDSPGAAYGVSTVISLAYFTALEGGPRGQTLGKMALGIRVIDFNGGGAIGYGRGFVRQIVKYISALVVLLGYLWMLWDREKQTWHDKAATDVVVPVDAYPVA